MGYNTIKNNHQQKNGDEHHGKTGVPNGNKQKRLCFFQGLSFFMYVDLGMWLRSKTENQLPRVLNMLDTEGFTNRHDLRDVALLGTLECVFWACL